jgi:futalosine hydrolase
MGILLVAATKMEIEPFLRQKINAEVLITGIGIAPAVFHLTRKLSANKYDCVIQAGIAGAFVPEFSLGDVFLIKSDAFADSGIEENGTFQTLFEAGFLPKNEYPYADGMLVNHNPLLEDHDLPLARAVTVHQITSDPRRNQWVQSRFSAELESMEGAAFHYVCLQQRIDFLQVRAISNFVGERNKEKWEMENAVENLNRSLLAIIKDQYI